MAIQALKSAIFLVLALFFISTDGFSVRTDDIYQDAYENGIDPQELMEAEEQLLRDSEGKDKIFCFLSFHIITHKVVCCN